MKSILLVDDDPICNFLSTKAIQQVDAGAKIAIATNGRQALNLFQGDFLTILPDIILLDLNMPIMNGFEFLSAFAKLNIEGKENIKIIVLSSSANAMDTLEAKALGAAAFVTKPLTKSIMESHWITEDLCR